MIRRMLEILAVVLTLPGCDQAAGLGDQPGQDDPLSTPAPAARRSLPAFPGAEGYGASALSDCDRSNLEVLFVTNLNGDGAGSLRDALGRADPTRLSVVVFRTGGTIVTGGMIRLENSCLYVAGQTAPGGGIQIRRPEGQGHTMFEFARNGRAHNVVMRYLRIRSGKGESGEGDNITMLGGHDIILDHLSLQWANDEAIGIVTLSSGVEIRDVTLQRLIIAETLAPHNVGLLIGGVPDDSRPPLFQLDMHHNLFAHNAHRNPKVNHHKGIKVVNNVVYNSLSRVGRTAHDAEVDFINNYFRKGPWGGSNVLQHQDDPPYLLPSVYIAGNIADWKTVTDNRDLIRYDERSPDHPNEPLPDEAFRNGPIASGPVPITVQSAEAAYASVLGDVGANARLDCEGRWVSNADAVDLDLVGDVSARTGPASRSEAEYPDDYGGYPVLASGTACADTDQDGMPDAFETRYGLDPQLANDNRLDADGDGYTNLEEYLNGTAPN